MAGWRLELADSHLLLAAVILLSWLPLTFLPQYYPNLAPLPDGGLSFCLWSDVPFHLSLANELTHTVPPQVPFAAGRGLSYHYGMDLLAALLNRGAGLSVIDLTVRFLPTFFLTLAALAIFCFSRAWLRSGRGAALTTFLVLFAEDFSFVPGLLVGHPAGGGLGCWSVDYFQVPSTFSLYNLNPIVPALGLLFGGLFCLHRYFRAGSFLPSCEGGARRGEEASPPAPPLPRKGEGGTTSRAWLGLSGFFFATALEYKVFPSVQVLASLGIAGLVYLARFRDLRLLKVLALSALLMLPLLWIMWRANEAGARHTLRFSPEYLAMMLRALGLADTEWGRKVNGLLMGGAVTKTGIAALLLIALPLYLLGSLGLRALAIPVLGKELGRPGPSTAFRFFLATLIAIGCVVSLTCTVIRADLPPQGQYNNVGWFYLLSKHLLWLFFVELLLRLGRPRTPGIRTAVLGAVVLLSLPSTIQFFRWFPTFVRVEEVPRHELELITFLNCRCAPGDVILEQRTTRAATTALTRCRIPLLTDLFTEGLIPGGEITRRAADRDAFWAGWDRAELRTDVLQRYRISYLVVEQATPLAVPSPGVRSGAAAVLPDPVFENEAFRVYKVPRQGSAE
jgi:hypothetical protein